jgi:hypothetical protein
MVSWMTHAAVAVSCGHNRVMQATAESTSTLQHQLLLLLLGRGKAA